MIIAAILFMGGLGFSLALGLAVAARLFHVEEDPRLQAIKAVLPGLNCGACGHLGCAGAARALLDGRATVAVCAAGGLEVVDALMRATGKAGTIVELPTAAVHCFGPGRLAPRFDYRGPVDCRAAIMRYGGWTGCTDGCLGGGTCAAVCPFDAIRMDRERRPRVDPARCRGCGRCVAACPRGIIRLETLSDRMLHLDRTKDCLAPCRQKCPAQIDVPRVAGHLARGEKARALLAIKLRNPFPSIVGRTCPHPCETICRRNIADQGLAILRRDVKLLGRVDARDGFPLDLDVAKELGLHHEHFGVGGHHGTSNPVAVLERDDIRGH